MKKSVSQRGPKVEQMHSAAEWPIKTKISYEGRLGEVLCNVLGKNRKIQIILEKYKNRTNVKLDVKPNELKCEKRYCDDGDIVILTHHWEMVRNYNVELQVTDGRLQGCEEKDVYKALGVKAVEIGNPTAGEFWVPTAYLRKIKK